jgi:RHS repeat-associated protein
MVKIPFNTTTSLWSNAATGGNGTYSYRWQKSGDNMTWTDVGNASSTPSGTGYQPGNLTTSAYFRMRVVSGAQTAVSNSMLVEVRPAIEAGDISFTQTIAPNTQPAILKGTTAKGGTGQFTYQWQQSTDGANWQNIAGATGVDYQPPVLNATTWYRRRATQQGTQEVANTQVIVVFVQNISVVPAPALAAAATAPNRQPRQLQNLPGITAQHYNRTVQFEARRPGVTLQANLLNQPHTDGDLAISYTDGLQRPVQQVAARANTQLTDMISSAQYDVFGRSPDAFLPFSDNQANPSLFRNNPQTLIQQFYQQWQPGEQFLYSTGLSTDEVDAEMLSQSAPGNAMAGRAVGGRSISRVYLSAEAVWQFIIHNNQPALPAIASSRIYGDRDLTVEETVDANNRRLVKYFDLEGQLIMEKLQQSENPGIAWQGWNITYYVYDEMGNLRFVLPQMATQAWRAQVPAGNQAQPVVFSASLLDQLGFVFTYDAFGRVESKKVPGVTAEQYVYDRLGRQVISRDAKQALTTEVSHIEFDNLGRPLRTRTINTTTLGIGTMRSLAANSTNFMVGGVTVIETETYYDNYNFTGANNKAFNHSIMTTLSSGPNQVLSNTPATANRGRITGVLVRVLYPAGVPQGPQTLLTVNYYDRNGRLIQSQSDNILGGNDITAIRYDFAGNIISQSLQHQNPRIPQGHATHLRDITIRKRYEYYANGSLHRVFQQIGSQPEERLLEHEYNPLGQLTRKTLGTGIESLNYTYNIQGQLTGINEAYVRNKSAGGHHWWGTTLHYFNGFTHARNDGTLTGMAWRSRGHHRQAFAYGMVYDILGRIVRAEFTANTAAVPGNSGWAQSHNYTVDNISYDEAGNLLTMRSTSTAWGDTRVIDNLQYQYAGGDHRLTAVNDQAPVQTTPLANFRDGVQQATEYQYDANGNLIQDNNKGFTASWNMLEKPEIISFTGNRQLRFVYDATGQRLQKWATEGGVHTSISYIGGLVYRNDTLLLEFAHDAGRTRRNRLGRLVNDFYITDHLGNTRMVLTAERDTFSYHNTYETPRNTLEQATWLNRQPVRDTITSTTPFFNTSGHACLHPQGQPCPNHWASRLNGNVQERRVGTGIVLRIMSGDTLHFSTRAIYTQPHGSGWNTAQTVGNMVSSIIGAFVGPAPATFDGKANLLTNGQTIINTTAFHNTIQHQQQNTPANNTPRAFLKALFFDEQMNLTDSALIRISRGANTVHTYSGQRTAQHNGYVYVYATNESGFDVWFDDLFVTHRTGPLLQEAHFYPFGMEITPLSSKAVLKTPNERMLQQNEWDDEFGLDLHDFDARMYDASIGRFWGVDVYAENFSRLSPYNYAANNPYHFVDPDGRIIIGLFVFKLAKLAKAGVLSAKAAKAVKVAKTAYKIGGTFNAARNLQNITSAQTVAGMFVRAAGYFVAGGEGAAVASLGGLPALGIGMGISGTLNIGMDFASGELNGKSNIGQIFQSFAEGGSSAIFGKGMAKMFSKGIGLESPIFEESYSTLGKIGATALEKGVGNTLSKYATYGSSVANDKKYGRNFYWNAFWTGAVAGGLAGTIDWSAGKLAGEFQSLKTAIKFYSIPLNSITTTAFKNHLMYQNSNEKYRQAMKKDKVINNFWNMLNVFGQIIMFSEGYQNY